MSSQAGRGHCNDGGGGAQRSEGRSKSVWGEGRAGAQDDVEMMTMLIT